MIDMIDMNMIDIVLITTHQRGLLTLQSIDSLVRNAANRDVFRLTIVQDGYHLTGIDCFCLDNELQESDSLIVNAASQGASASRNIGASSIPKYRRNKYVMFMDDDVYMCKDWDRRIVDALEALPNCVVSGHSHPYNHAFGEYMIPGIDSDKIAHTVHVESTQVLSTVHLAMAWEVWDKVGFFIEPGGPGGSEDVDWCKRASNLGFGLAVTVPQTVIHCGVVSSSGKEIVGADLVRKRNEDTEHTYGIEGKVKYA